MIKSKRFFLTTVFAFMLMFSAAFGELCLLLTPQMFR